METASCFYALRQEVIPAVSQKNAYFKRFRRNVKKNVIPVLTAQFVYITISLLLKWLKKTGK